MASSEDDLPPSSMSFGKPSDDVFDTIFRHLGAGADDMLVPPAKGFDNGVLRIGRDKVLVFTVDPVSFIPSIGPRWSAWLSLHHLASDLATSGVRPRYALFDYNLPGSLSDGSFRAYLSALGMECRELGISIVGGHTGSYPGCGLTIIGSGVLFAEASRSDYITPGMAEAGDKVIVTKGPAIEATAVLSHSFPLKIGEALGSRLLSTARRRIRQCSTLADSLVAASIGIRQGGVTSMHDATEGGIIVALQELALASGKEVVADLGRIPVPEDVAKVCSLFGLEPFATLSEGTLVITCRPNKAERLLRALADNGIPSFEVGKIGEARKGGPRRRRKMKWRSLAPPKDKYWSVYARGVAEGWR